MKKLLILLVVFLIVAPVAVLFSLGPAVRSGVEFAATEALGSPTTLESATVSLFGGSASLENLRLGNAKGFKEPYSFEATDISVKLDVMSLLGDVVSIDEIIIASPRLTLEASLQGTNIGQLLNRLSGGSSGGSSPPGDEKPTTDAPASSAGKRLRVGLVRIETPSVILAQSAWGADRREYNTETVELKNLGDKDGTIDMNQLLSEILGSIMRAVGEKNNIPPEVMDILNKDLPVATEVIDKVGGAVKEGLDKIFKR